MNILGIIDGLVPLFGQGEESYLLKMIKGTFTDLLEDVRAFIPKLVFAVVYFIIGYLLARVLAKIVSTSLSKLGFDGLMETIGLDRLLKRLGINSPVSTITGKLLFWGVLILFLKSSAENMEIEALTQPLEGAIDFLPKVITAVVIVLIGFLCADFARKVLRRAAEGIGLDYAITLSNVLFTFFIILVSTLSLRQLGLETTLIDDSVKIVLAGLGLAFAIAIGAGLRPLAQNVVSGVYAREIYKPGIAVKMKGEEATVTAVGPMMTKLEKTSGGFFMVPNSVLMSESVECE